MYRTPAVREPEARPARELVYEANDETARRSDGMSALFRHFSLPLLLAGVVGWLAGPVAATAALAGAAAYSVWSWRSRKRLGGAVLTVDRDVLAIELREKRPTYDRVSLGDLADVVLQIKTIERVMDGGSAIPAVRFIDSKVAPKVDTARIVLVRASGEEVPLTSEYLPHMHATEWLGKIRTFLRKHGWVPEDEREGGTENA
jgi:hypothetical protein